MTPEEKRSIALAAYHDGELSRFARWLVERQLRKSPALRRELAELAKLSNWVRESESAPASLEIPDPWSEIGPALSRIDREIDKEVGKRVGKRVGKKVGSNRSAGTDRSQIRWNWGSLAAGGALAALVLAALTVDNRDGIPEHSTLSAGQETGTGSLRYLQTNGVFYVASQDSGDVTIIWLMDAVGTAEGA